jgi:hypothetical protein
MHKCMVSGCPQEGVNKLGIRCRVWNNNNPTKGKTAALWSPDTDAYLCDVHALSGATITVITNPMTRKASRFRLSLDKRSVQEIPPSKDNL